MRNAESSIALLIHDYGVALEGGTYRRPLSEYTVRGYLKALNELDRLLGHPALADFTLARVAAVITAKRKVSPSNARLLAAVAKTFSKWLWKTGLTNEHILDTLGVPAFNGRRKAFTDTEFRTILRALNDLPNRTRKRDRAMVLFGIGSGVRSKELWLCDLRDLHIEKPLANSWALLRWNTTKSQEERRVRVAEEAAAAIYDYIASDRKNVEGPLFLRENGEPFTYDGWQKTWAHIADRMEAAGVDGFSAHRLRHQWATLAARDHATEAELCQEGGWRRGSKVPSRYIDEIPFPELQRRTNPMTAFLRRSA